MEYTLILFKALNIQSENIIILWCLYIEIYIMIDKDRDRDKDR